MKEGRKEGKGYEGRKEKGTKEGRKMARRKEGRKERQRASLATVDSRKERYKGRKEGRKEGKGYEGRKEGKGYEGRKLPQTRLPAHQCFPFSHPLPCFSQQNGMVRMPSTPTQMLMGLNISSTFCTLLVHFSSVVPTLKLCSHLRMWVQCWPPVFTAVGLVPSGHFSIR